MKLKQYLLCHFMMNIIFKSGEGIIMKNIFCENCMKDTECKYDEGIISENIDGFDIEYLEKRYICSICHEKVYDEETSNYNILEANNKLREKTGLITIKEIKELSSKYNIGVKPLALVMGLGEVTIMRYLEGKNPTKEISDKLKLALKNPEYFEVYLMSNQDKITDLAFKKALGRVKQLELSNEHSKIYQIALYIIGNYEDTTNMALQKILYFVNGFSKKFLGKYLFDDVAQAWIHGPVYPEIYNSLAYFKKDALDSNQILANYEIDLNAKEKEYLDSIVPLFARYSGSCLRNMSHLTKPWIDAREGLAEDDYSDREIANKDIDAYFKDVCSKYEIVSTKDIYRYIMDLLSDIETKKELINI